MKGNKFYSESFKRQVVYEVNSGFLSKAEAIPGTYSTHSMFTK